MDGSLARPVLNSGDPADRPLRLSFSRPCVIRGQALVASSVLCLGIALFLATHQIPYLDDGMKRADMFALLSCFLAVFLLFTGWRLVLSRVVMTATELSIEPEWCGFRAEWSEIRKWSLEDHPEKRTTDLLFWLRLDQQPSRISSSWLEPADFQHILTELQRRRDLASHSSSATN